MSVLEEVLFEEYERANRIKKALENEFLELPKGSIQRKLIHNVECYYLVYREGKKVKSKYINTGRLDEYRSLINRRKENEESLKQIKKSIKQIEKALGKDLIDEYTAKGVY